MHTRSLAAKAANDGYAWTLGASKTPKMNNYDKTDFQEKKFKNNFFFCPSVRIQIRHRVEILFIKH